MKNDFSVSQVPAIDAAWADGGRRRPIGHILRGVHGLTDIQIETILKRQIQADLRFGEAAVELEILKPADIQWALAQQFNYPYALEGQLGKYPELVCATDPFSAQAEAIRDLRSQLIAAYRHQPRQPLAVLSAGEGEGKSFVAANLAIAFAQLGGRTVLVDAAMRAPRQQVLFRLDEVRAGSGLSAVLAGQRSRGLIHEVPELGNLWVMPVGHTPPHPLELLQQPVLALLLQELLNTFDHVVVDTSAASCGADARVVAAACGAGVIVGRKGKASLPAVRSLQASLTKLQVLVAGLVLNDF